MAKTKKRVASFVKKVPRASAGSVQQRIAALIGGGESTATAPAATSSSSSTTSAAQRPSGFLSKLRKETDARAPSQRKAIEVVTRRGIGGSGNRIRDQATAEVVHPDEAEVNAENARRARSSKDLQGLTMLKRAVRDQSHMRPMPHQERPDFEFRLRRVATSGVIQLFNALSAAQKAGEAKMTEAEAILTLDKAQEKKQVASRDAFLAAVRKANAYEGLE